MVSNDPFADFRAVLSGAGSESVFRLMPVSDWARKDHKRGEPTPPSEGEEAIALLEKLTLPVPVTSLVYPRGCRIRRVRVPAAADETPVPAAGPVIVSRRALQDLRTSK